MKMEQKEDYRRGKRNKGISTNITQDDWKTLKEFKISYSQAIEGYIDFVLNQYGLKERNLIEKQKELEQIQEMKEKENDLIQEIQELKDELNFINLEGLDLSPKQKGTLEKVVREYQNIKERFNGFNDYLEKENKTLEMIGFEIGIKHNRFIELLIVENKKQEKELEQIHEVEQQRKIQFIKVSKDVGDDVKLQIHYCIKRSYKIMKQQPTRFPTFQHYIDGIKKEGWLEHYVKDLEINEQEFMKLCLESYGNLKPNKLKNM